MVRKPLLSRDLSRAICDALGIDYKLRDVVDVSISMKPNEIATVSVCFLMTREVVQIISEELEKQHAENQP